MTDRSWLLTCSRRSSAKCFRTMQELTVGWYSGGCFRQLSCCRGDISCSSLCAWASVLQRICGVISTRAPWKQMASDRWPLGPQTSVHQLFLQPLFKHLRSLKCSIFVISGRCGPQLRVVDSLNSFVYAILGSKALSLCSGERECF